MIAEHDVSLPAVLVRHATEAPGAPAFYYGDYLITYEALTRTVAQAVTYLADHGLRPGKLAGIQTPDSLLHVVLTLACEALGAASMSLSEHEVQQWAEGVVLCDALFATANAPHPAFVRLDGGTIGAITGVTLSAGWQGRLATPAPLSPLARVIKSSGTTGTPKPIALSPASVGAILRHRCDLIDRFGPEARLFVCIYGPVFYRSLTYVRAMLLRRRMVAFGFTGWAAATAEATPPWFTLALPGHVERVIAAFRANRVPRRAAFLDINGAAVDPRTHDLATRGIADRIVVNYGMNEATGIAWIDRDGVGTLCPEVEVRIERDPALSTEGRDVGLIAVRAPTLAIGYPGRANLTAAHFVDGWFRSGDVGFQPASDRVVVLGRADDMLNVGGMKLAPGPLEAELCTICDVQAAVLLTTPDGNGVQRLCAVIERDGGAEDPGMRNRVEALLRSHADKVQVVYLPEFPRNESGKVRRDALRAMLGTQAAGRP
ncbi:MAG TPA: class I adenylate-forming enzyme family protein [Rhodopila sp.]|nr:class I adenylate-forming enzyme family protein [Rhodopila sp.]